jgi:ribosomal protein L30/L7E
MFVRLKLEDTRDGLVATISQRGDDGKITGRPSIFLVRGKEEAKQRAKAVARALGLRTYGVVDKTSSRVPPSDRPSTRNRI